MRESHEGTEAILRYVRTETEKLAEQLLDASERRRLWATMAAALLAHVAGAQTRTVYPHKVIGDAGCAGKVLGFDPATGQVTYAPNDNYNGLDLFSFTVTDDATPATRRTLPVRRSRSLSA